MPLEHSQSKTGPKEKAAPVHPILLDAYGINVPTKGFQIVRHFISPGSIGISRKAVPDPEMGSIAVKYDITLTLDCSGREPSDAKFWCFICITMRIIRI
jgi:hypothetical protein